MTMFDLHKKCKNCGWDKKYHTFLNRKYYCFEPDDYDKESDITFFEPIDK